MKSLRGYASWSSIVLVGLSVPLLAYACSIDRGSQASYRHHSDCRAWIQLVDQCLCSSPVAAPIGTLSVCVSSYRDPSWNTYHESDRTTTFTGMRHSWYKALSPSPAEAALTIK